MVTPGAEPSPPPISAAQRRRKLAVEYVVCVAIIGLLISILLPTINRMRESSCCRQQCPSNLKSIGQGMLLYANDHEGTFPDSLATLIQSEEMGSELLVCPSSNKTRAKGRNKAEVVAAIRAHPERHVSYIYMGGGLKTDASPDAVLAYEPLDNHDGDGANVLFGDGHVSFYDRRETEHLIAELQAGHNPPRAMVGR